MLFTDGCLLKVLEHKWEFSFYRLYGLFKVYCFTLLTTDFIKAIGVEYVCIVFLIARDDQRILIEPKKNPYQVKLSLAFTIIVTLLRKGLHKL